MTDIKNLLETVDACADRLEELSAKFPQLSSEDLVESVEFWRKVRPTGEIEIESPASVEKQDLEFVPQEHGEEVENRDRIRSIAIKLLENNGLEDTLDILSNEHHVDLTIKNLILLVGKKVYVNALKLDAGMLRANAISYDQIAELWNDMKRPAFGGDSWTPRNISLLLE